MFYLFHHIPKTAGTSCSAAFGQLFNVIRDLHENTNADSLKYYSLNKVNLAELGSTDLLWGHYNIPGHYLYQRYPSLDLYEPRKIIFFREPLETAISGVRFGLSNGWFKKGQVDKMLINRVGYFSKMLQCTNDNYHDIIDTYYFVGLTETIQDSFDAFSKMTGKISPTVERLNSTVLFSNVSFSQDAIDVFNKNNQLDLLIYQYAKTRASDFIRGQILT
jgi:hypothetical protein